MTRLLFAAARGARIEYNTFTTARPNWVATTRWLKVHHNRLRIHPDDEHLAYGPISTALREFAAYLPIGDKTATGLPIYLVSTVVGWYNLAESKFGEHCAHELHRSLFLLILAEALADEGL